MPSGNPVTLVPYRDDILQIAAERITHRCAAALPDLADCVVLLPELQFAPHLRWQLLQSARSKGHPALLGPVISTLEHWLSERFPVTREIPGRARRELMLVAALQAHRAVFSGVDPWHIANDLIALFDELTLNRITLPGNIETFTRQLGKAYGVSGRLPEPLGMEAAIVHRLWQAWHEQLDMEDLLDPGRAYLQRLAAARSDSSDQTTLFLVGFSTFSSAEIEWISDLLSGNRAELILRAPSPLAAGDTPDPIQTLLERIDAHPAAPRTSDTAAQCLEAVFRSGAEPPAQRASEFSRQIPQSPLSGQLAILAANTAEQEAQAIDLQVRQWLLAGRQPIGIVTEDRRLARRVRALLERAAISLQDSGGWALSTTSAAAALESWLETVEEDFAHQPLLDVLKSAFIFPDEERATRLNTVHRLEQDIILHENIARGLARYRRHIGYRLKRLPTSWTKQTATALQTLLNRLDQAAEPLRGFIGREPATPARLLEGLRASLETLGMWDAFDADPAGRRILNEWDLLHQAARHSGLTLNWPEFRAWLGTALERHDFHPATGDSPVLLLTLQQARTAHFDALIIGACDREHLPASPSGSPFFNDGVRTELGLPVWPQQYQQQLHQFRCLLESAPRVLLTYYQEDAGETRLPSPWLEAIQTFHQLAWGDDLGATELEALVPHPAAQVRGNNPLPRPAPAGHPAPVIQAGLQPKTLSASSHQRLIDCPYRFFAADALKLKPREAVSEALEKSDYGGLIHQCLEAFHGHHKRFPGPFGQPLTATNRAAAIAFLQQLSTAVFSSDVEDNFEHRAWLRRWEALIPEYIDWQSQRENHWRVSQVEQRAETRLAADAQLHGRLDRIDAGPDGIAIIDYKTGSVPKQDAVDAGEAVQLPTYALLTDTLPVRVEYLKLDPAVSDKVSLEGSELGALALAVKERLVTVLDALHQGAPLPAWGDAGVCQYCEMDGLCRQQAWVEQHDAPRR